MNIRYASRMEEAKPSIIRELLKLSADPSIISFAGGNPDATFFPAEGIKKATIEVLDRDPEDSLQYSVTEGNVDLRNEILKMMEKKSIKADIDNIAITSGSQQGLDLTGKLFIDEGDTVIVESPSYMGAINAFKFYRPKFIEANMDDDGMDMDDLEQKLRDHPNTKFIYTIPDFQNPTGRTMSRERREKIVELAEKYNTIIIEDSPYYDLRFEGDKIPPIKHFDKNGRVVYLGSVSKILCPALRVGWIIADPKIIKSYVVLKQAADLHTNELGQRQIASYLKNNDFSGHIREINGSYKDKLEIMLDIMDKEFPEEIDYTVPKGGLFVWVTMPEGTDSQELFKIALEDYKVAVVPGDTFYPYGGHPNTFRLSFATVSAEKIEKGMHQLAKAMNEYLKK